MKEKTKKIIRAIEKIIKQNCRWIILFLCVVSFIVVLENVFDSEINDFDTKGYNLISKSTSKATTVYAKVVTGFANPIGITLIAVTLFVAIKNKKIKYSVLINLITATVLNCILKIIIQRPRPTEHRIIDERGYSFPSGHSMVSMAFYGYILYLIFKNVKSRCIRFISALGIGSLIVSIGLSRIYLGVHYPSDVLGGFLVAISYLTIYTGILKRVDDVNKN